jgi:anti-anti-sigma regulatory factor
MINSNRGSSLFDRDRRDGFTALGRSLLVVLAAGLGLGTLFFAQPLTLERWGQSATALIGAALLLSFVLALGMAWRELRRLRTTSVHLARRVTVLEGANQRESQLVAELERRSAEQANLSRLVATLSAPLIPVTRYVVIVPLVGAIDSERLEHIRTNLLRGIDRQRARAALIDLTGVPEITPQAIELFTQLIAAVELMGCRVVLTGISTQLARMLIDRDIHLPVETHRDVMAGLTYAMDLTAQATTFRRDSGWS